MRKRKTYICLFVLLLLIFVTSNLAFASEMRILKSQKEIQEWNETKLKWETVDVIFNYDMIPGEYRLIDKIEYTTYQGPNSRIITTQYFYANM